MRGQFVLLYRELVKVGLTPPQVDAMEMWQIGAMFDDETVQPVRSFAQGGIDPYLKARLEAARAGEQQVGFIPVPPKPNPQPLPDVESTRV